MEWQYTKENPLKVFTAFSGYDSQCLALRNIGIPFELVGWSEIDKYAIRAHDALFPEYKDRNLGDICKIDWDSIPDIDLLTYSSPCFVAGTLVLTDKGFKKIEDIVAGDKVLTHNNRFREVVTPISRDYVGGMIRINAMPFHNLECTAEHPFYVRRRSYLWHSGTRRYTREFSKPEWIPAKELSKDTYLGVAINTNSIIPKWRGGIDNRWGHGNHVNKLGEFMPRWEFWYLMGRYVGDGWKRESKTGNHIIICCSDRNHDSLIKAIESLGWNYNEAKERTVTKVRICGNELFEFVGRYGQYAYGKRVDGETLGLPVDLLRAFHDGYFDSDGALVGKTYKTASVSEELTYGIGQCVAKVYHVPYKIYKTKRPKTTVIEGRTVSQRDTYQVCWKLEKGKQDQAFYEDGYLWMPIREVSRYDDSCTVYNMEVKDDNSYTANGVIVHNCQDFSNAGLQRGGQEGSGTRSSLLWEVKKAILAKHPHFLLMENVKALVSAKFLPTFRLWLDWLTGQGYTNFCQILNAKDYGIPQNRERIFVVSILGDAWYSFPQPVELKLRLKDMLEEKVDEKYYLPQDKVNQFVDGLDEEKKALIEAD